MADNFGPIFTIKLGLHRVLVVSNSQMAKECLTTNDRVFASKQKSMAGELMGYNYAMFELAPNGSYWRKMRKTVVQELASRRRVQMPAHIKVSKDMYRTWMKNKGSSAVAVYGTIGCSCAIRCYSLIPGFRWLDLGGYAMEMKKTAKEMDVILDGWLQEHKKKMSSTQQLEDVFMTAVLSRVKEELKQDYYGFSIDTIVKSTCLVQLFYINPSSTIISFINRFLTKEVDVRGQHLMLIPLGSGIRICPGISFALEAVQFILANIIHGFEFENPSNEQIDMTKSHGITILKATTLELLVAPRLLPHLYGDTNMVIVSVQQGVQVVWL
ncbi:cytochrome P450 [Artemisia annua]|uniref:Cytochrome P450 n=1 Tax=Artemisia annua TaxID=35608 RepID=A0A2U1PLP6_ARTAN|nr:cytochrome P450 [Artemisia annua]